MKSLSIVNKYIRFRFQFIVTGILAAGSLMAQEVAPLLTAKYNQNYPYNASCPSGTVTGCGPTAIAQILNLYKKPAHGYGYADIVVGGDTVIVDMSDLQFDWNNILDSYQNGEYGEQQASSVADLMYACGAAMRVRYGSATSVSNYAWMLWGLQHNLHLSPESRYLHRKNYTTAEWIEKINDQLHAGHPVFYRGTWFFGNERSDHMFVIDGLDYDGKYHVNFGHGGKDDKYCDINILNQTGEFPGGKGVCYNASQVMVTDCYPTPDFNDYPLQASISEEPIILNGDVTLQETEITLGDTFTLSCRLRNFSMEKTTITFGWALIKEGEVIDILGQGRYTLSPGYTFKEASHRTIKLPKNLNAGDYRLVLYSKSSLDDEWRKAWRDAATEVDVIVEGDVARVIVPPNHIQNPNIYLTEEVQEIENIYDSTTPGRMFTLTLNNTTVNNFENKIKFEIDTEDKMYEYETVIPVYSQTSTPYRILVPTSLIDLRNQKVTAVRVFYYYDQEERHIEMPVGNALGVIRTNENSEISGDIQIYTITGTLFIKVKAVDVLMRYNDILNNLPNGIYVIKEGNRIRKIVK